MREELMINEIFHSIQGESTWAGVACTFIRLTGCHLRCGYCDTEYAFHEGRKMSLGEIMEKIHGFGCRVVEVTGGEPLLQKPVHSLMKQLCDERYTVLLETSGSLDIQSCDSRIIRIMDIKTPGSGEEKSNRWENFNHLNHNDEIKLVLTDMRDYQWSRQIIQQYNLVEKVKAVLLSAVNQVSPGKELAGAQGFSPRTLADRMLADQRAGLLPGKVRFQMQLHKLIWDPTARGV